MNTHTYINVCHVENILWLLYYIIINVLFNDVCVYWLNKVNTNILRFTNDRNYQLFCLSIYFSFSNTMLKTTSALMSNPSKISTAFEAYS